MQQADPLRAMCEEILKEKGWDWQYLLDYKRVPNSPHALLAAITLDSLWKIIMRPSADLEERLGSVAKSSKLSGVITQPERSLIYFASSHEHGHWFICPFNEPGYAAILNAAREVLAKKLTTETAIETTAQRAANIVGDLITNAATSYTDQRASEFVEGFTLFYLMNAQDTSRGRHLLPSKFPDDFAVFVNSNLTMMQAQPNFYSRLRKTFRSFSSPVIDRDTKDVASILLGDELGKKAAAFSLTSEEKRQAFYMLRESSRWYEVSGRLTEIFYRYLKDNNSRLGQHDMSRLFDKLRKEAERLKEEHPEYAQPQNQPSNPQSGSGTPYDLSDDFENPEGKRQGEGAGETKEAKSGSNRESNTNLPVPQKGAGGKKDEKRVNAGRKMLGGSGEEKEKEETPAGEIMSSDTTPTAKPASFSYPPTVIERLRQMLGEGASIFDELLHPELVKNFEELDRMYRERAAPLIIDLNDPRFKTPEHNFAYLSKGHASGITGIDWARTRMLNTPKGRKVQLFEKQVPLKLDIPSSFSSHGLPDLAWIIDSSSSMNWYPAEGTGPYDTLLRIMYSIHLSLERAGRGAHMNYAVLNYSGKTSFSGWQPYQRLDDIHRAAFAYQALGTHLNHDGIRKLGETTNDAFMAFMITDGGFNFLTNEDAIVKEISALCDKGNYFALFQIREHSNFSIKIKAMGFPVYVVNGPSDLYNLTVSFAREMWGGKL